MDLFGENEKALVIQLVPRVNTLCEVETDNIAMTELELNLSEYFDHSRHPKDCVNVTAGLDVQYEPTKNQFAKKPEGLR